MCPDRCDSQFGLTAEDQTFPAKKNGSTATFDPPNPTRPRIWSSRRSGVAKITGRAAIVGAALAIFFGGMASIAPGVAAAAVPHSGRHLLSPQLGAGAGTNIGDATQITGSASGSLASSAADDWWVIYPSAPGATVTVRAENTTSTSSTCGSLIVTLDASDGTESALASLDLSPSTSNSLSGSQLQSDRYFVEVTSGSCNPPLGQPTTYTLTLQSGGGGSAPSPAKGSIAAGTSIGTARPPLQGKTNYSGTITSGSSDDWYALTRSPTPTRPLSGSRRPR